MFNPNRIIKNAKHGKGPCKKCPSHEATKGQHVNPGFSSLNAKVMFITQEPKHETDWGKFKNWGHYNKSYANRWFLTSKGGNFLKYHYLDKLNLRPQEVWVADSLKCKLRDHNKKPLFCENTASKHCNKYLAEEIATINPLAIVTLGAPAAQRTLLALKVDKKKAKRVKVTQNYGRTRLKTEWPVIISLHWASMSMPHEIYLKKVLRDLHRIL